MILLSEVLVSVSGAIFWVTVAISLHRGAVEGNICRRGRPESPLKPVKEFRQYVVIVDAGSSGSRVRVYGWEDKPDGKALPDFEETFHYKMQPGVSKCADNSEMTKYVLSLVSKAVDQVPKNLHKSTAIYFLATAGMRMMLEEKANNAIEYIHSILSNETLNPFIYSSPDNSRILSGEEEGLFAWIAANYLAKNFDTYGQRKTNTFGILELGGASTQIAFVPHGSILDNKHSVRLAGVTYNVYVRSYLIFGQEQVDRWIKMEQYKAQGSPTQGPVVLSNPCMLSGDITTELEGLKTGLNVTIKGTGQPAECLDILNRLIYEPAESWRCNPKPCAIGTAYQPTIRPGQQFFVAGAFRYPLRRLDLLSEDGHFSLTETMEKASNFCRMSMDTIRSMCNSSKDSEPSEARTGERLLSRECLTGLYMPLLFTKAYKFSNTTRQIRAPMTTTGILDIEWPLGAVIYEYERQRCKPECHRNYGTCPVVLSKSSGLPTSPCGHLLNIGMVFWILRWSIQF